MTMPSDPTEPTTEYTDNNEFVFTSLNQMNRRDLVNRTSSDPAAAFVAAKRLELTALGANVDLHGFWAASTKSSLANWSEIAQGGRTMASQITYRGYLFPLGHKAIITTYFLRVIAVDPLGGDINGVLTQNNSSDPGNFPVAYLQTWTTIQVVEPVKSYPALGQPFQYTTQGTQTGTATTDWPFASVRFVTTTSPTLLAPSKFPMFSSSTVNFGQQASWPQVDVGDDAGVDLFWDFVATDLAGNDVPFSMPLVFVYGQDISNPFASSEYAFTTGQGLAQIYQSMQQGWTPADHYYWSETGGVPLQFAPGPTNQSPFPGTTHPALLVGLGASGPTFDPNASGNPSTNVTQLELTAAGQPAFYPTISTARIRLHVAESITGQPFGDTPLAANAYLNRVGPSVQFDYYPDYVQNGINTGSVYLAATNVTMSTPTVPAPTYPPTFTGTPSPPAPIPLGVPLNMPGKSVGGIGTPNLGVTALSAAKGVIGGTVSNYASTGASDITEYFPSQAALGTQAQNTASQAISQLLGGLNLGDILSGTGFANATPTITSAIDPATGAHTITYSMSAQLASWPSQPASPLPNIPGLYPVFVPDDTDNGMLNLNTVVSSAVSSSGAPQAPQVTTTGSIDPFAIWLLGNDGVLSFFMLHFESFTFTAGNGGKPSVNVNVDDTEFEGCLSFINMLSQFLESLGGNGVTIDVEALSVSASITIALPDLSMGMFSLTGLSLSGALKIPFIDGITSATFGFASQDDPFTLTVACFGGGGWVALAVGFDGIQSVQAQFEFTGELGIDLVVVSGSVSVSAGIYFGYFAPPAVGPTSDGSSGVTLSGFVHIVGQVQVLGIITVTATLVLTLTYMSEGDSVTGTASCSLAVSICGFSKSVSFSVTKTFSGNSSGSSGGGGDGSDAIRGSERRHLEAAYTAPERTFAQLIDQKDFSTYCNAFSVTG